MIKYSSYKNRKEAFTLVEICIAAIIIILFLLPMFTLLTQGNKGTLHNRNEIYARNYATNILNYCGVIPYDSPCLDDTSAPIEYKKGDTTDKIKERLNGLVLVPDTLDKIDLNIDQKRYGNFKDLIENVRLSIETIDAGWTRTYKLITVTISWKEPGKSVCNSVETSGMVTR